MMRYWKTTVLTTVSVLCLGTYYITTSSPKPDYYIQTVSGDEKAAASIEVKGANNQDALTINLEGSKYRANSFLQSQDDHMEYNNKTLNDMFFAHDSFMRGKRNSNEFCENEKFIGHARMKPKPNTSDLEYLFTISIYEKANKQSSSFEVIIPKKNMNQHSYWVEHVWFDGQTIKVITIENRKKDSEREVHLYTFSLEKKSLLNEQLMGQPIQNNNGYIREGIYEQDRNKPQRFVIYQGHLSEQGNSSRSELYVYDLQNGTSEQIKDEKIKEYLANNQNESMVVTLNGDEIILVLAKGKEKDSRILRYHLLEKKVKGEFILKHEDSQTSVNQYIDVVIKDNQIFLLSIGFQQERWAPIVHVIDLNTGLNVYKGYINQKIEKESDRQKNYMWGNLRFSS
ncbi:hypothetical protein [Paenibacillus sp. KN14-4R]|uniref:hypothetical protein n=1 Tax=Paenibacillus sp. KN14-4R TaxID=3445773 RepID=UPI003FA08FEF